MSDTRHLYRQVWEIRPYQEQLVRLHQLGEEAIAAVCVHLRERGMVMSTHRTISRIKPLVWQTDNAASRKADTSGVDPRYQSRDRFVSGEREFTGHLEST